MPRLLLASFLAALALFVWGFVFWAVLPTDRVFATPNDGDALARVLREQLPRSGVYALPDPALQRAHADDYARRHAEGPVAMVFAHPAGRPAMPPSTFVLGFLQMLATSVAAALLLRRCAPALPTFGARVGAVMLAFVVAVTLVDLAAPIWWTNPWQLHALNGLFHLSGGLLVALVLARLAPDPRAAT